MMGGTVSQVLEAISRDDDETFVFIRPFGFLKLAPADATEEELEWHAVRLQAFMGAEGLPESWPALISASLDNAGARLGRA